MPAWLCPSSQSRLARHQFHPSQPVRPGRDCHPSPTHANLPCSSPGPPALGLMRLPFASTRGISPESRSSAVPTAELSVRRVQAALPRSSAFLASVRPSLSRLGRDDLGTDAGIEALLCWKCHSAGDSRVKPDGRHCRRGMTLRASSERLLSPAGQASFEFLWQVIRQLFPARETLTDIGHICLESRVQENPVHRSSPGSITSLSPSTVAEASGSLQNAYSSELNLKITNAGLRLRIADICLKRDHDSQLTSW